MNKTCAWNLFIQGKCTINSGSQIKFYLWVTLKFDGTFVKSCIVYWLWINTFVIINITRKFSFHTIVLICHLVNIYIYELNLVSASNDDWHVLQNIFSVYKIWKVRGRQRCRIRTGSFSRLLSEGIKLD